MALQANLRQALTQIKPQCLFDAWPEFARTKYPTQPAPHRCLDQDAVHFCDVYQVS